ncbi:hypothetical protein [Facklamia miroungae]|uniref:Uncharacterized protein n=1 Tax=Facklamia miroungae TaxID=120956 RepID=A0A1G7VGK9_9LACT|nr:hypothetical protein [Facklamia miroungae]NKZ30308.1 hypothetical protein [Facklamia miroungae]SDG58070.1 hypothetical protein SAMN05421791_1205 [Facklamia miroungae]
MEENKLEKNNVEQTVGGKGKVVTKEASFNEESQSYYHPHHVGHLHGHHRIGENLSWRAVLAGLVTFVALSMLFSLIGAAIGLGATDLTAANPLDGVGMGLIIWTIISLILSLAGGGFIAGYTAHRAGLVHGFLTWASGLIIATVLASSAITGTFNTIGAMFGATTSAAGNVVGNVAQTAGDLSQDAFNAIADNLQVDTSNLDKEVQDVLEDTEIEQLQPDYLQNQLDDTVSDIQEAAKSVVVEGKPADEALKDVYSNIEDRMAVIEENLDEEALSNAIADNTDLNDEEAEKATDNIIKSYEEAQTQAKDLLADAKTEMNRLEKDAKQAVDEGVETTNDVMNEASKYSIYAFIGAVLGLVISAYAGKMGAERELEEDERVVEIK